MTSTFRFNHNADLTFFFNDLDALTGCGSSFDTLANLALSGIPDGGTIAQPTKARMGLDTPSDRAARIREVLAMVPASARILAAHYLPSKWNAKRMAADPCLSPLQREFRQQAGVVQRLFEAQASLASTDVCYESAEAPGIIARVQVLADAIKVTKAVLRGKITTEQRQTEMAKLSEATPLHAAVAAELAVERASQKARRAAGRIEAARLKRLADVAVVDAQRAYQGAAGKHRRYRPEPERRSDLYDAMADEAGRFGGVTRPPTSDERAEWGQS